MYIQEEFIIVDVPMQMVETVMTDRDLMRRWMSPAVQFTPVNGWQFDEGARWQLGLTGLGNVLTADYVVCERREGLILWHYTGFWHGYDAWHWFALPQNPDQQTVIQNRLEYTLDIRWLDPIWPFTFVPFMDWDARVQMQRLKQVCETASIQEIA